MDALVHLLWELQIHMCGAWRALEQVSVEGRLLNHRSV